MKKLPFYIVIITVALFLNGVIYLSIADINEQSENEIKKENQTKIFNRKSGSHQTHPRQVLAYQYVISTKMINNENKVVSQSSFQGKIALKQMNSANYWLGQVIEPQITQQGRTKTQGQSIVFKTQYQNYHFEQVNFLGLEATHPANAITHLLSQLSYQIGQPLTIENATSIVDYDYSLINAEVVRKINARQEKVLDTSLTIKEVEEQWALSLAQDKYPIKLNNSMTNHYQNHEREFSVKQTIKVVAIDEKFSWPQQVTDNQNASIRLTEDILDANISITSDAQLHSALAELATVLDEALAKAVGKYLIENYTLDEITQLLNSQDSNTNTPSLIIYSIQKNPNFAAETVLVGLLEHPEMIEQNKQRIVMSLGRFEAVSDLSFQRLESYVQQKDNKLANTAQLSIGTVARFNQDQHSRVNEFLAEQLIDGEKKSVTLLAIHNSGLTDLNQQAVKLLGDKSSNINVALIKLLASDPNYHQEVIDYAINSSQAKSISELKKALSANKLRLSNQQKSQVLARIKQTDNRVIKDQLNSLLNVKSKQW